MTTEAMAELGQRLEERERHAAALKSRIVELERELEVVKLRHVSLLDMWGIGATGARLPLVPLLVAIVGAVLANAAAFCGFVVFLTRWSNPLWSGPFVFAAFVVAATLLFSKGEGAGGRARVGLRWMTVALLVLGVAFAAVGAAV
jgi:hypothetical protein